MEFPGRRSRNRALQGSRKGYQKCAHADGCSTFKKQENSKRKDNKEVYVNLAFTSEITVQADKDNIGDDAVSVVIPDAVAYLPLEDLVDFEKEKERLNKEKDKLTKELARSRGMLSNEKFLNNAKPEKVQEEKDKLAKYEQMMEQVQERLAQMK